MGAPRGVQVSAAAGDFKATCRKELHLQSTEGEVSPGRHRRPFASEGATSQIMRLMALHETGSTAFC